MAKNDIAIKKLKILVTVVDRQKGEFYLDYLSQFEVNLQMLLNGAGTATSEIINLLGLNNQKAVILSVAREDLVEGIMNGLEEKFRTIKNGRGISFAVPLSSVIGVNLYRFMSNNRMQLGG
jgi:hypothetical protein